MIRSGTFKQHWPTAVAAFLGSLALWAIARTSLPTLDWVLDRPHVAIGATLMIMLAGASISEWKWPEDRKVIELLAYGSGVYGAWRLLQEGAVASAQSDLAWVELSGGAVLMCAALHGAYGVIFPRRTEAAVEAQRRAG